MDIKPKKVPVKKIPLENDCEILVLTKKLRISLDSEAIRNIIGFGMDSLHLETKLKTKIKESEEKKDELESDFRKIALKGIKLEAKYIGVRNQFGKIYRENRALTMRLCARAFGNKQERVMRDKLIQKYLIDFKRM